MTRQILAVAVGILLSFLLAAAGGWFLHRFSGRWSESQLGALARYVLQPFIALFVGSCAGLLAKSNPKVLAVLSLLPSSLTFVFFRRIDVKHSLLLILLSLVHLIIGMVAATVTFRLRRCQEISSVKL
jgi:hypothetical protein